MYLYEPVEVWIESRAPASQVPEVHHSLSLQGSLVRVRKADLETKLGLMSIVSTRSSIVLSDRVLFTCIRLLSLAIDYFPESD